MDKSTIQVIIASLDERERDELSLLLAFQLLGSSNKKVIEHWLRSLLSEAAEKRGIGRESEVDKCRAEGM